MERNKSVASTTGRSFLSRTLTRREGSGEPSFDVKGAFGLNTLYRPEIAVADLIFVHGLGGGSRSTWTKNGDNSLYWPKEWLPNDPDFQDVRIHSFGYDSNWDKESTLSLYDFAKSLLSSLEDCPTIPRGTEAPLMFVGHSMGGLVIKRAYILARQKAEFRSVADRTSTIMFLATPHRGADLAQLLKRILSLFSGSRPFVDDLNRNSPAIQSINDEFPQYCQHLQLYSFYETLPTNYGIGKGLVVEKDLAVLGYSNERSSYLNANHREVCKYANTADPNYQTVRNALASVIDTIRNAVINTRQELGSDQTRLLDDYLGLSDAPENEFMDVDNLRMQGSCEWIFQRPNFRNWRDSPNASIYWVSAAPATGKTILSGSVIRSFRQEDRDMSFYLFDYRDKSKTTINGLLVSMAWQMAHLHPNVLAIVLNTCENDNQIYKADYRTVWRKLFVEGILRTEFARPHCWVIDALDECKADSELVPLLLKVLESGSIRIFITCRDPFEAHRQPLHGRVQVVSETIRETDTRSDIILYLEANRETLPAIDEEARRKMVQKVLDKSAGCFLWVSLILQELRQVHTSSEIDQVLDEVPSDMDQLYRRVIEKMSARSYGKILAKAILTWTVCCIRPLTTDELFHGLQLSLKDKIDNVKNSITSSCGQLVYVDAQSQVQMVHQTARDFLLQLANQSEFAIDLEEGHRTLAMTCLQYLNSKEMKGARHRKLSTGTIATARCPFVDYACNHFFEHILLSSCGDRELVTATTKFLSSSNVLAWVEYVAIHRALSRMVQAGKSLKSFSSRASRELPSKDLALLSVRSVDLIRLVTKFGKSLLEYPSAIFSLIPPFCPPHSAIRRQFAASARDITVLGLTPSGWDDLISTIIMTAERLTALECSDRYFAIGMASGRIAVHNEMTCLLERVLFHQEHVRVLGFAKKVDVLASAGAKMVRLWSTSTWEGLWMFESKSLCMSVAFVEEEQLLLGAMKNNLLMIWDVSSGALRDSTDWTIDLEGPSALGYRRPVAAAFCMDSLLLAVVYRGQDILLWDLERDTLHDTYCKEKGSRSLQETRSNEAGAMVLVFSLAPNSNLLAVSYSDGDLVLFDTEEGIVLANVYANAQTVASSLDGRTLATGNSSGIVQLFQFETLVLLYRFYTDEYGIQKLQFSGDNHRLLDIRGSQCRVWDPTVLVRDAEGDENSEMFSEDSAFETPAGSEVGEEDALKLITAIVCPEEDDALFCGKDDGSVHVYDRRSGKQAYTVFGEEAGAPIKAMCLDEDSHTLSTVNVSSQVTSRRLSDADTDWRNAEILLDHRVGSAVRQLLCNQGATRLLISTVEADLLWSIYPTECKVVHTLTWQDRGLRQWCTNPNPKQPNQLILILGNTAHLYDWQSLTRLTNDGGILLEGEMLQGLSIKSIMPCFDNTAVATVFADALKSSQTESKLFLWTASDFWPGAQKMAPVPKYRSLTNQIKTIVGGSTQDLVFLHSNNWVCSASANSESLDTFNWHFILPADWLSANPGSLFGVTRKKEIIVVKRDEIAVVRRGLENVESLAAYESVTYGDQGAIFTFAKQYDAPQMWTNFYILFGRVSTVMQIAPGKGIISSSVLISDDFDEIDQEFSGNNFGGALAAYGRGQNNYFGKGITGAYDRGAWFNVTSPQTQFHTYTIDWSPTSIVWSVDGQTVRTLLAKDCTDRTHQYPQSPSKIQIGMWDGGDASEGAGTADWAGGYTNLSLAPFTMYVKSVTIENTHPATGYNYTDKSGNWTSIGILHDKGNGGLCDSSSTSSSVVSSISTSSTSLSKSTGLSTSSLVSSNSATTSASSSKLTVNTDATTNTSSSKTASPTTPTSKAQSTPARVTIFTVCPASSNPVQMRTAASVSQTSSKTK
ncbi:MAG: hypothetical protein M1828_006010 [Chrysothrix sp. TS-e1954]|nr:MAG: hypothetical protein M1828_006010 [Chrysothrix sp. TS-e1954]